MDGTSRQHIFGLAANFWGVIMGIEMSGNIGMTKKQAEIFIAMLSDGNHIHRMCRWYYLYGSKLRKRERIDGIDTTEFRKMYIRMSAVIARAFKK